MEKELTIGYQKEPTSLYMGVLKRILSEDELEELKDKYIKERNRAMSKRRGVYCPHCGEKLPVIKD